MDLKFHFLFQWNGLYHLKCTRLIEPHRLTIAGATRLREEKRQVGLPALQLHSKIGIVLQSSCSCNPISARIQAIQVCVVLRLTIRVRNPFGYLSQDMNTQNCVPIHSSEAHTQRQCQSHRTSGLDSFSFYHVPGFLFFIFLTTRCSQPYRAPQP